MDPGITDHVAWGIILPQLKNSSHIQGSCDMIQGVSRYLESRKNLSGITECTSISVLKPKG